MINKNRFELRKCVFYDKIWKRVCAQYGFRFIPSYYSV